MCANRSLVRNRNSRNTYSGYLTSGQEFGDLEINYIISKPISAFLVKKEM